MSRRAALWIAAGLILLVWGTRLISIDAFPPFIDETIHIHSAEVILHDRTPFFNVVLGRQLTIWWLTPFQPAAAAPTLVARAAILLSALPGFAALLALARMAGRRWGLLLFGLCYLFSAYDMFFGRLALADPFAATWIALAILLTYRLTLRVRRREAVIVGALLFLAFASKSSAAPYYGIPLAGAVALVPRGTGWRGSLRKRLIWLGTALGTAFALTAAYTLLLRLRGYDIITNSLSLAVNGRGMVDASTVLSPARVLNNVGLAFSILSGYLGAAALAALLLAVIVLLARRSWYLPLCLFGPLAAIWLNTAQETRYYVTPMALLLLCGALVVAQITRRRPALRRVALGVTLLYGALVWLPFTWTADRDPSALPLPAADASQYLHSDSTGFGFADVYALLRDRQPRQVIGALSNCQGLRFALSAGYPITCPQIRPDRQDIADLTALFEASRAEGVYLVLEDSPYVPETAPGQLIGVIDAGRPRLSVYDLAP